MIDHTDALDSAKRLAEYCRERFNGKMGECDECLVQLHKDGKNSCYLGLFLGFGGEHLQKKTEDAVELRDKELAECGHLR